MTGVPAKSGSLVPSMTTAAGDRRQCIGHRARRRAVVGERDAVHTDRQSGGMLKWMVSVPGRGVGREDRFAQRNAAVRALLAISAAIEVVGAIERVACRRHREKLRAHIHRKLRRVARAVGRRGRHAVARHERPHRKGERELPRRGIHRARRRAAHRVAAEEGLALAIDTGRVGAFKEFHSGPWPRLTGDRDVATGYGHAVDHGEVYEIVCAAVAVTRIVGRDAIGFEVDAEAAVRGDRIALDRDAGRAAGHIHSELIVPDEIARAARRPTDRHRSRATHRDAAVVVAERRGAIGPDAEVVALDYMARPAGDVDAVGIGDGVVVPGDDVARAGGRTPDGGGRGAAEDKPIPVVAQGGGARGVGADEVALNDGAARRCAVDGDAVQRVARDQIARTAATDDDAGRIVDADAFLAIAEIDRPAEVGADVVVAHDRAGGAGEGDAAQSIARDDIAIRRRLAADGVAGADHLQTVSRIGLGSSGIAARGGQPSEEVAGEGAVIGVGRHLDSVSREIANDQSANRAAVRRRGERQPVHGQIVAIEDDHRRPREIRLGRAIDDDRAGERRQRRADRRDRVRPDARDIEKNEVDRAADIGRGDRLAQRDAIPAWCGDERRHRTRVAVDRIVGIRDDERLIHRRGVRPELRGLDGIERSIEPRGRRRDHRADGDIRHELRAPRRIAAGIRAHIHRAEVGLPLTIAGSIAGGVGENLDAIKRVGRTVERAAHRDSVARIRHRAGQRGKVL